MVREALREQSDGDRSDGARSILEDNEARFANMSRGRVNFLRNTDYPLLWDASKHDRSIVKRSRRISLSLSLVWRNSQFNLIESCLLERVAF